MFQLKKKALGKLIARCEVMHFDKKNQKLDFYLNVETTNDEVQMELSVLVPESKR